MSIVFIGSACSEPARQDEKFGLCDDQNGTKAYSNIDAPKTWIATVINEDKVEVVFTPIDNCIKVFKENGKDEESRCDGMLTTALSLYLVELKNQKEDWIKGATDQLVVTLNTLKANHTVSGYKYKKLYACNKKHRHFQTMEAESRLKFFREHNFRLDIQAEIKIK